MGTYLVLCRALIWALGCIRYYELLLTSMEKMAVYDRYLPGPLSDAYLGTRLWNPVYGNQNKSQALEN